MEIKERNEQPANVQNENSAPLGQAKRSGIPVPVWKRAASQRQVLGSVSLQTNLSRTTAGHKTPPQPPGKPDVARKSVKKQAPVFSHKTLHPPRKHSPRPVKPSIAASREKKVDGQKTPKTAAAIVPKSKSTSSVAGGETFGKSLKTNFSLLEEQQQNEIVFHKDSNALKSILTNTGIALPTPGSSSDLLRPQRATEGQGRPVYTPAKHAVQMRNSAYTKEPRMSLMDSYKQYKQFSRQARGIEEEPDPEIVFHKDSNALKSILTNTGIALPTPGSTSDLLRPQRATEGQGRPVYTPAKHAALIRNSAYTNQPRMSLMDSCKQYQQFHRQARGIEEESVSASPVLTKASPKSTVSESPFMSGAKAQRVTSAVYDKWSKRNLFSPFTQHTPKQVKSSDETSAVEQREERVGTPRTPLMTYRRVPVTPGSARGYGGRMKGTPSQTFSRVAKTPTPQAANRSSCKPGLRTETRDMSQTPQGATQSRYKTGFRTEDREISQTQDSTKKRLRWADILNACSPENTDQARHHQPQSVTRTTFNTSESEFNQATKCQEPVTNNLTSALTGQTSSRLVSLNTAESAADDDGQDDESGRQAARCSPLSLTRLSPGSVRSRHAHIPSGQEAQENYSHAATEKAERSQEAVISARGTQINSRSAVLSTEGGSIEEAVGARATQTDPFTAAVSTKGGHFEVVSARETQVDYRAAVALRFEESVGTPETNSRAAVLPTSRRFQEVVNAREPKTNHRTIFLSAKERRFEENFNAHTTNTDAAAFVSAKGEINEGFRAHKIKADSLSTIEESVSARETVTDAGIATVSTKGNKLDESAASAPGRVTQTYSVLTSSRVADKAAASVCCESVGEESGVFAPQTDILTRLQILEKQERDIQDAMRTLRMAMQKEQEADSNGNISHTSPSHHHTAVSTTQPAHLPTMRQPSLQLSSPPPPPLPLKDDGFKVPQTNPCELEHVSCSPCSISRNLPSSCAPLVPTVCNQSFCNPAVFDVASDSSSPPDINSNTLTSVVARDDVNSHQDNCLSKLAGNALTEIWPRINVERLTLERKLPLQNESVSVGMDGDYNACENLDEYVISMESSQSTSKHSRRELVLSEITAENDIQPGKPADRQDQKLVLSEITAEEIVLETSTDPRNSTDTQVCGLQTEQHTCGALSDSNRVVNQSSAGFTASTSFRQSVDMDVEDSDNEDDNVQPRGRFPLTPVIPQTPNIHGLAGRDQTRGDAFSNVLNVNPTTKTNPVSVIVKPCVVPSPPCENHLNDNAQMSPPIWTRLALLLAAKVNSGKKQSPSVDTTQTRDIVLSKLSSPTKHVMRLGNRLVNTSPSIKGSVSPSKKSSLHGTLRHRPGGIPGSAFRSPDIFMEALLEDECALYAGRLQSFFTTLQPARDRLDLDDPVARVLSEGDDMHFIPIPDDCACSRRTAVDDSAFSYITV